MKTQTPTLTLRRLKITIRVRAADLPPDFVLTEGLGGVRFLDLVLEGGEIRVRARLNGRKYRKVLKQVAEYGADQMVIALQGVLRPPLSPGGPFVLENAGFMTSVLTPRPGAGEGAP